MVYMIILFILVIIIFNFLLSIYNILEVVFHFAVTVDAIDALRYQFKIV